MTEIQHWDENKFREASGTGTVLVDFFAEWCGPCKIMAKTLEAVAAEAPASVRIAKIDVEDAPGLAAEFQIASIPTLIVLKDGKAVYSRVGVHSKEELLDLLAKHV